MMSRLIDADALVKDLLEQIPLAENVPIFKDIIESQPTAYDVDKVVKHLEIEASKIEIQYENNYEKGLLDEIGKAIEIVKQGGKS